MIPDIMDGISLSIISLAKDKKTERSRSGSSSYPALQQRAEDNKTPAETQDYRKVKPNLYYLYLRVHWFYLGQAME